MVEDFGILPMFLAIGTLLAVVVLALWGKKAVQARRRDDHAEKSLLASDTPNTRAEMRREATE